MENQNKGYLKLNVEYDLLPKIRQVKENNSDTSSDTIMYDRTFIKIDTDGVTVQCNILTRNIHGSVSAPFTEAAYRV